MMGKPSALRIPVLVSFREPDYVAVTGRCSDKQNLQAVSVVITNISSSRIMHWQC